MVPKVRTKLCKTPVPTPFVNLIDNKCQLYHRVAPVQTTYQHWLFPTILSHSRLERWARGPTPQTSKISMINQPFTNARTINNNKIDILGLAPHFGLYNPLPGWDRLNKSNNLPGPRSVVSCTGATPGGLDEYKIRWRPREARKKERTKVWSQ